MGLCIISSLIGLCCLVLGVLNLLSDCCLGICIIVEGVYYLLKIVN